MTVPQKTGPQKTVRKEGRQDAMDTRMRNRRPWSKVPPRPVRGPLWRRTDELEWRAAVLAALFVVLVLPLAVLVGLSARQGLAATARHQAATSAPVTATVLDDPLIGTGYAMDRMGAVRWTDKAGIVRVGPAPMPAGVRGGATLRIWVTPEGVPVAEPMTAAGVLVLALGAGSAVEGAAVVAARVGLGVTRRRLDRRRLGEWAKAWDVLGAAGPPATTPGPPPEARSS